MYLMGIYLGFELGTTLDEGAKVSIKIYSQNYILLALKWEQNIVYFIDYLFYYIEIKQCICVCAVDLLMSERVISGDYEITHRDGWWEK